MRATASMPPDTGAVEAAAALPDGTGWLLLGWTTRAWPEAVPADALLARLTAGTVTGPAVTAFHPRPDRGPGAQDFVTMLDAACPPEAVLLALEAACLGLRLPAATGATAAQPLALAAVARRRLHAAAAEVDHPVLRRLPRLAYDGTDTLAALRPQLHLEVEQAIRVPPDGLALTGWFLDLGGTVRRLRVRGDGVEAALDPRGWVTIPRPDVLEAFGPKAGLEGDALGFLAHVPGAAPPGTEPYLEVETADGTVAHKPLRVLDRRGLAALKQVLSVPRPPQPRLQAASDAVFGPIVEGLNRARLAGPRRHDALAYGTLPQAPGISLIVTLYERLDFLEYQLALFSERPDPGCEILYVLDDPRLREEAERLAASCHRRFGLPFRLLLPEENLGFAPANNLGLHEASGEQVCLLNSDVFPMPEVGMAWLPALARRLREDPGLGVVGPLLLYEDGTVQHQGMHYERVPGLPPWPFPIHTRKGAPPPGGDGLLEVAAVTGACMVLRRAELLELGGLDEGYVVGDFEDSDLCQQLRARGRRCVVDLGQRLYHLERQSQGAAQPWRGNVTLHNAWRHHRKWGGLGLA